MQRKFEQKLLSRGPEWKESLITVLALEQARLAEPPPFSSVVAFPGGNRGRDRSRSCHDVCGVCHGAGLAGLITRARGLALGDLRPCEPLPLANAGRDRAFGRTPPGPSTLRCRLDRLVGLERANPVGELAGRRKVVAPR